MSTRQVSWMENMQNLRELRFQSLLSSELVVLRGIVFDPDADGNFASSSNFYCFGKKVSPSKKVPLKIAAISHSQQFHFTVTSP